MENRFVASSVTRVAAVAMMSLAVGYIIGAAIAVHDADVARLDQTPFVNTALDIYGHGKVSRDDLLQRYNPTTVYLPNMTCVAMKPRRLSLGGEDVLCFDKAEKRLLFSYTSGD
jgi:hypothetical protein